jgi:hypothetical protein
MTVQLPRPSEYPQTKMDDDYWRQVRAREMQSAAANRVLMEKHLNASAPPAEPVPPFNRKKLLLCGV